MRRVLLVPVPADEHPQAFAMAARALRDAGHEVVHGVVREAAQISAIASQEDVDTVLLVGEHPADVLAGEVTDALGGSSVRVVPPGADRSGVLAAVEI